MQLREGKAWKWKEDGRRVKPQRGAGALLPRLTPGERRRSPVSLGVGGMDTTQHCGAPVQQKPQDEQQEDVQKFTTGEKQN